MIKKLIDLLLPRRAVCMGCGSMLGCDQDDICDICRVKLSEGWVGVVNLPSKAKIDGLSAAYGYHSVAGQLVRRLKYGNVRVLDGEMGADIARAAEMLRIKHVDFIAPVPMHPKRLRKRGYNQSKLLADRVSERMEIPCVDLLVRTRNDAQQVSLSDEERRKNLRGAFAVNPEWADIVEGSCILLIDDVYTTGTTADQCALALKAAGAAKVYFAAYAVSKNDKKRRKSHG